MQRRLIPPRTSLATILTLFISFYDRMKETVGKDDMARIDPYLHLSSFFLETTHGNLQCLSWNFMFSEIAVHLANNGYPMNDAGDGNFGDQTSPDSRRIKCGLVT